MSRAKSLPVLVLIGATMAVWIIVAIPTRWFLGEQDAAYATTAVALCLIPATLTLAWSLASFNQTADQQLVAILGGAGLRIFVVLLAAWGLFALVPYFQRQSFWLWVLGFYLFTLLLELLLLLSAQPAAKQSPSNENERKE